MGRGKLKMQLMSNSKERRRYFEKRKKSVEKAAKDLSTLCGVDIGMIILSSPDLQLAAAGSTSSWPPGNQQQVLDSLIVSAKTNSRIKTYSVSDMLKKEKMEEEEKMKLDRALLLAKIEAARGKLNFKIMKDQETTTTTSRLLSTTISSSSVDLHEKLDRAELVAKLEAVRGRINMLKGETSLFKEPIVDQHESGPSTWSYEQLQAAGFDCYNNSDDQEQAMMMINYGGDDDMCMYSNTEPLMLSTNYNVVNNNVESTTSVQVGPYDFALLDYSSDTDRFTSSSGDQQSFNLEDDWYLNQDSFLV